METRPAVQVASKTLSKHGKLSTTNVFELAGTAAAAPVEGVVTVVKSIEEAASLHMWQQGDEEMYTLQHVQERFVNRFHPEVVLLLSSVWWPTALRGLPIEGWDGDTLRTWSMPQRNHALMIVKLCRALLEPGEPLDAAEAERFSCTAWEEDSRTPRAPLCSIASGFVTQSLRWPTFGRCRQRQTSTSLFCAG